MVIPPITQPFIPVAGNVPGDIKKGVAKLTIGELSAIANGGSPFDVLQYLAPDFVESAAVPEGKHRVIQRIVGWGYGNSTEIWLYLLRNNVYHTLAAPESVSIGTIGADVVAYNKNISNSVSIESLILKPGDIIGLQDINAIGSDVELNIYFVDVFL